MRAFKSTLFKISVISLTLPIVTAGGALADTKIEVPGGKSFIIIRPPNQNALTPADKNWGRTSFSLIDKMGNAESAAVVQEGPKGSAQAFTRKTDVLPKNATVINSGEDEAGSQLLPVIALPLEVALGSTNNSAEESKKIAQAGDEEAAAAGGAVVIHVNANRSSFVVFTADRQCASGNLFGSPGTLLMGTKGTIISTDGDKLILHNGRLLAATGTSDFRVATRDAGVKVGVHSAAIVEYKPGTSFQTVPVYMGAEGSIKVKTSADTNTTFSLKSGEKYAWDLEGNGPRSFDIANVKSDPLLARGAVSQSLGSTSSAYARYNKQLNAESKISRSDTSTTRGAPVRLMASDGTEFMVNPDGTLRMFAGWMFLHGPANTAVSCAMGSAVLKQETDVTIQKVEGYFRVGACSGSNSVMLTFDQYKVPISLGEEVLLTDHDPSIEELQAGDGVLRRHVTKHPLKNQTVVLDDFSIFSLLYNATHLSSLRKPSNAFDRYTRDHLLKNMAAIQFSTTDRGEYTDQPKIISVVPTEQLQPDANGRITISRLP